LFHVECSVSWFQWHRPQVYTHRLRNLLSIYKFLHHQIFVLMLQNK
jgi:hypothetical protein